MRRVVTAVFVLVLAPGFMAGLSAQESAKPPAEAPLAAEPEAGAGAKDTAASSDSEAAPAPDGAASGGTSPSTGPPDGLQAPPPGPGPLPPLSALSPSSEAAPAPSSETVTLMSDQEETGDQLYMLPDRVERLILPDSADSREGKFAEGPAASVSADSLFPPEIWPPPPERPSTGTGPELPDIPPPGSLPATPEMLAPDIAAACFGTSLPPPLCDPQGLLPPAKAGPLRNMLARSLNERGGFQASVVLLKPHQQIPVTLDPAALLQRWHGNRKGLLIIYFYGRPDRTQAFFTPETRRHHRAEDLRQVIDYGVREAARMAGPAAQLERFCYKTAARLDRLHRQGVVAPGDEAAATASSRETPGGRQWWLAIVGMQAAALAAGGIWWWRRRRLVTAGKGGKTVLLPDQEWAARLGAPHSGGSGAVIQFGVAGQRL